MTKMKEVSSTEVTLDWEAHDIPEDARENPFLDWMCSFAAYGDDGKLYWSGGSAIILAAENVDIYDAAIDWDTGVIRDIPGSIFKVADFPKRNLAIWKTLPGGTRKITRTDNAVIVTIGNSFKVVCSDDNTWHYTVEDKEKDFAVDFTHYGVGMPLWYGKEKPSYLTPHSIAYGYNWSGRVEGDLTIQGRKVHIKGAGVRERYVAVDSSTAEIGGWEDWGWFHFEEAFGSMYEMKMGIKDMALTVVDKGQLKTFPTGNLIITHHDWAYLPALDGFIPTKYTIRMEVEAGMLEFTALAVGGFTTGVKGIAPSTPVVTEHWDHLKGTFTFKDGRVLPLTNGFGGMSIKQFKPYPETFGLKLFSQGELSKDNIDISTF